MNSLLIYEFIDVGWKDDAWTTSINMPVDGANVSIKKTVAS